MKYILCYGDSNTWGCVPETFERYDFNERWTGILQEQLGGHFHVYENGLNGRTTVFQDQIEEMRCGRTLIERVLMENMPLDYIVMMLGVNDLKCRFDKNPWDIGWGIDLLLTIMENAHCGREGGTPEIILIAPPHMTGRWGKSLHGTVFDEKSLEKSRELAPIYEFMAKRHGCHFMDAEDFVKVGEDSVHLTKEGHKLFSNAVCKKILEIEKEQIND